MITEIVCVGTELLLGDILNTNARYLARELAALGTTVYYQTVVGDNMDRLVDTLRLALGRSDLVITTGGLGPTADDITCEGICRALGVERKLHAPSLERIRRYFECAKRHMTENNNKQAMLPEGCEVFDNTRGTAPGCVIEKDGHAVMMLPGPPGEMRVMFELSGKPWIAARSDQVIVSHTLHVFGVGEASAEQMAADLLRSENPTVAPYAKCGEMEFRVTARAHTEAEADALCAPMLEELRGRLGGAVYATDVDSLEKVVLGLLKKTGKKVTFAESCTGGLLAKRLTDLPGASEVFENSFVTYSNGRKHALLGVPEETLSRYGAVSRETACAMAIGALRAGKADVAAAITGIAGPGGGTPEKPVGLSYAAVTDGEKVWVREVRYAKENDRGYVRHGTASHALDLLRLLLLEDEKFLSQGISLSDEAMDGEFRKAITPIPVFTGNEPE